MPSDEVMQAQLNELKGRVESVEIELGELNMGLKGTMDKPGAFEIIRRTNEAVTELARKTDTVVLSLSEFKLKEAKVLGGGLVIKAVLVGGGTVLGWFVTHLVR